MHPHRLSLWYQFCPSIFFVNFAGEDTLPYMALRTGTYSSSSWGTFFRVSFYISKIWPGLELHELHPPNCQPPTFFKVKATQLFKLCLGWKWCYRCKDVCHIWGLSLAWNFVYILPTYCKEQNDQISSLTRFWDV